MPTDKKIKGRNSLEDFCWRTLSKEGISFQYEPVFELVPSFEFNGLSIEKYKGGSMRTKTPRNLPITYKPDFVGNNWVIETKGLRRAGFDLRWKLFKKLIKDKGWLLLLPGNQTEVLVAIDILKKWLANDKEWDNKRILQLTEDIKLQSKTTGRKPKTVQVKKRRPTKI